MRVGDALETWVSSYAATVCRNPELLMTAKDPRRSRAARFRVLVDKPDKITGDENADPARRMHLSAGADGHIPSVRRACSVLDQAQVLSLAWYRFAKWPTIMCRL